MSYHVCLSLDARKRWLDQQSPVVLKDGLTLDEANALMEWVGKDLQARGLYIDRFPQKFQNALQVKERTGDELAYIGCIFAALDPPRG